MIHHLQVWLITYIRHHSPVAEMMRTAWGWPIAESLHFIGLCLLVGSIGAFDLRLLGVMKRVPIAAVHRFIPWGIAGFAINICSGLMFLLTEPDQYVLNASFHLKLLFLTIAGVNAGTFYLTSWRVVFGSHSNGRKNVSIRPHTMTPTHAESDTAAMTFARRGAS